MFLTWTSHVLCKLACGHSSAWNPSNREQEKGGFVIYRKLKSWFICSNSIYLQDRPVCYIPSRREAAKLASKKKEGGPFLQLTYLSIQQGLNKCSSWVIGNQHASFCQDGTNYRESVNKETTAKQSNVPWRTKGDICPGSWKWETRVCFQGHIASQEVRQF